MFSPYTVSKATVIMVTAKYAARFKDDNLVFLSLSPGVVNSQPDMGEVTPFLGFLFYFI